MSIFQAPFGQKEDGEVILELFEIFRNLPFETNSSYKFWIVQLQFIISGSFRSRSLYQYNWKSVSLIDYKNSRLYQWDNKLSPIRYNKLIYLI